MYDFSRAELKTKIAHQIQSYDTFVNSQGRKLADLPDEQFVPDVKWTRHLKNLARKGHTIGFDGDCFRTSFYRPYVKQQLYFSYELNEFRYQIPSIFPKPETENALICFTVGGRLDFAAFSTNAIPSLTVLSLDANQCLPMWRYDESGNRTDNITDWALKQFKDRYKTEPSSGAARHLLPEGEGEKAGRAKARPITKRDIFHYVYAVLHDPLYREKYAQNLKREFPRIPFYPDFWRWAEWGRELMALHIGYESVEPWPLARTDIADEKACKNGGTPKAMLKADKDLGRIVLDSETTLSGVPAQAWEYKLGNRSALEWILDQHKEKKPKDPTIREKFNTYPFADYKDKVIDLLARVTRVSVQTQAIVEEMKIALH